MNSKNKCVCKDQKQVRIFDGDLVSIKRCVACKEFYIKTTSSIVSTPLWVPIREVIKPLEMVAKILEEERLKKDSGSLILPETLSKILTEEDKDHTDRLLEELSKIGCPNVGDGDEETIVDNLSSFKCPKCNNNLVSVKYKFLTEDKVQEEGKKFFCNTCNEYVLINDGEAKK